MAFIGGNKVSSTSGKGIIGYNTVLIQGLMGMGLIGYNIVKFFLSKVKSEAMYDYAEFFPHIALIENGLIENQCARLYQSNVINSRIFYSLIGPQPRTDELSSFFMQKYLSDLKEVHINTPIDLYISFGAFITDTIVPERFGTEPEAIANNIIESELNKKRNLYVATCGTLDYDEFALSVQHPDDSIIREPQGYISGLNGVLPAVVGERLKIPTVTIMIEASMSDFFQSKNSISQFLGLLAANKGLAFIDHYFDLNMDLDSLLTPIIEELTGIAKQDIITVLTQEPVRTDEPRDRDTMYI